VNLYIIIYSVTKFRFFKFCGDDDDVDYQDNDIVCFPVLGSTCSRTTTKTLLCRWSILIDVKNWIDMRNWKWLFVNSQENNRTILPAT